MCSSTGRTLFVRVSETAIMLGESGVGGRFTGALSANTTSSSSGSSSSSSSGGGSSASSIASTTATLTTATVEAAAAAASAGPELPIRLRVVTGFQNRVNDVVYSPPIVRHDEEPTAVVYFGGDVQDFVENMEANRDSKSYIKYNLEATSQLLRQGFPKAHVIVVRPARMEFKTFSCFDNFVRGNNAGVPDHTPMHHSLQHLEKLLHSITQRLVVLQPSNNHTTSSSSSSSASTSAAAAACASNAATVAAVAAAAAAVAAAAAAVGNNHSHPHINDAQDMDIDILQVQETVTVDPNGTIVFDDKSTEAAGNGSDALPGVIAGGAADAAVNNCGSTAAVVAVGDQTTGADDKATGTEEDAWWWQENLNLDKCKLILIGFSKGCVVLNQFIYEFHYLKTLTPDDLTMIRLLSRIKDMYWLDGGHGGAKNTWITSRSLLETLTRLAIQIHVHVTPYQVQDERRPWIRREEKTFVELLRRLGAPLQRCLHFDSSSANLYTHFEVLQVFRQPCPPQPAAHISPTYDDDDDEK